MRRAFRNLQTMSFSRLDRDKVKELLAHGIMAARQSTECWAQEKALCGYY